MFYEKIDSDLQLLLLFNSSMELLDSQSYFMTDVGRQSQKFRLNKGPDAGLGRPIG